ncbi:type II secretion system protein GspD [Aliidongia dinghuensis]|uniref:Type II secretion system protein GspD n=1 Tax=Aliidongia dinghuensis TaxID=1867774 RepID=A0A8J2YYL5_9PROT|nr:type II secretion system secretin GspD [Aliidongia dinghuensis]GGF36503.1 type II secretion system protein GspD [Aliidongia dinghuensis]
MPSVADASAKPQPLEPPEPLGLPTAQKSAALVHPGTDAPVRPVAGARSGAVVTAGDDVSLNFVDTDLHDVMRSVLGDLLGLSYVVDPKLQANITVQTTRPLHRDQVLPALQGILRADGFGLVETAGVYRVVPIDDLARHPASTSVAGQPVAPGAVATQVVPLKYISAASLRQTIDAILPKGVSVQTDSARNLLILTGTGADVAPILDLVRSFDVDWLAAMSFAIYPVETSSPRAVVADLDTVFGTRGTGPLAGALRFEPLDRLNAVLVVAPQAKYLEEARRWVERFDRGDDESTPRLFQYHVQNTRAADLARVISQVFGTGTAASQTTAQIAPGANAVPLAGGTGALGSVGTTQTGNGGQLGNGQLGSQTSSGQITLGNATTPGTQTLTPTTSSSEPDDALATGLKQALGAEAEASGPSLPRLKVVADDKNNILLVYARPRDYRMLEETLQRLDVVPLQVLIEATIAEVTLNNDLKYGLQWFFTKGAGRFSLSQGTTFSNTSADVTGSIPGFNYVLGGTNTKVVLSALSDITHVNVVSSPELLVLDHRTAALQVGDQVPVINQTSQSTLTSNAAVIQNIEYVNTGVVLQVTPRVNKTGIVTLDIDQSVSDVAKTTSSGIDSPTITQRRIVTSAVVKDGATIALGGLILSNKNVGSSGIPLLSDIPVLGALFGTQTRNDDRTELLILLTPRIIRDSDEAREVTEELRNRLEAIKPALADKRS